MSSSSKQQARRWADALRRSDPNQWDAVSDRVIGQVSSRQGSRALHDVQQAVEALLTDETPMEVCITSARPLTSKAQHDLVTQLFGDKLIDVTTSVDPKLIAGVVVRTPNELWDLSVHYQLERLKRSIIEA